MARLHLSPISKVPPEILSEIFVTASASDQHGHHRLTGMHAPIPSILSFVCQLWRDIALHLPPLWKAITFNSQDNKCIRLSSVIELYLSRSRGAPISIRGTLFDGVADLPAFDALLLYCNSWWHIDLRFSYTFIPRLNTVMHRVPLLQQLSLDVAHPSGVPRWLDEDITAFLSAPVLNVVSACDTILRHAFLPSDQIHALTATDADLRFALLLANKSYGNLRHLVLRGWSTASLFDSTINLPQLSSICLVQDRKSQGSPLKRLFELLDLPLLTSLHVEGSDEAEQALEWSAEAFTSMAGRHAPFPLKTFSLNHIAISEIDLLASLLVLPLLETLSIGEGRTEQLVISDSFVLGITQPSILVPHLSRLSVAGRLQFTPNCLSGMLKSRSSSSNQHILTGVDPGLADLCLTSLTLVTGLDKITVMMDRLLQLDAELPSGVSLQAQEGPGTMDCAHCNTNVLG
ncbi:hypothetical protein DXG01_014158 [Tephrocybe rancida]|nr:hypothetical protein DXG01_014158 [Tephrocybe rancida]